MIGARDATTSKERNLFGSDHLFRSKYHDIYIDIFGGKCSWRKIYLNETLHLEAVRDGSVSGSEEFVARVSTNTSGPCDAMMMVMMMMITMTMLIPTVMWEILSKCKLEKRMHLKSSVVFFSRTHYLQEGTLDRSEPKKGYQYYTTNMIWIVLVVLAVVWCCIVILGDLRYKISKNGLCLVPWFLVEPKKN